MQRLINNWVYGGFLAGILLLLLTPLLSHSWPPALTLTFLLLPVYMLHQYEEHDADRFRIFFNRTMGKGNDVLSPLVVFLANVPGVWGVIALSLTLAACWNIGFALTAIYLVLVNAIVHIIHALIFRCYNPGLFSAIFLFLPLGFIGLHLVQKDGGSTLGFHALGLLVALGIHAVLLIHAQRKLRRITR